MHPQASIASYSYTIPVLYIIKCMMIIQIRWQWESIIISFVCHFDRSLHLGYDSHTMSEILVTPSLSPSKIGEILLSAVDVSAVISSISMMISLTGWDHPILCFCHLNTTSERCIIQKYIEHLTFQSWCTVGRLPNLSLVLARWKHSDDESNFLHYYIWAPWHVIGFIHFRFRIWPFILVQ